MQYILKHKDCNVAYFSISTKEVDSCILSKCNQDQLPLPLKRLLKPGQREEFLSGEDSNSYELNEDGCFLFDDWLSNREIPVNRDNYRSYISANNSPRKWMLQNNGYSFDDCYWILQQGQKLCWSDILQKRHTLDTFYTVKDKNGRYKGHSATLGGQLEKFWFSKDNKVLLCKRADSLSDILLIREVIASTIYNLQGSIEFCNYKFAYGNEDVIVGCVCESFIDDNTELVTAHDLLEEFNLTQSPNVWEELISKASTYGVDTAVVQKYLDMQTLVDFIISNRDRHQNNIAFVRDADSLRLLKPAPVFDSGSSKYMEGLNPETLLTTTVNGLYSTEIECLKHVHDFSVLDLSKLPDVGYIELMLNKSVNISSRRKSFLLKMYTDKIALLNTLHQKQKSGEDIQLYLQSKVEEEKELEIEDFFIDGLDI